MRALAVLALFASSCCCITPPASSWCAEECARAGACELRTERTGDGIYRCYAGSDADCAGSALCRDAGRCAVAEDGECVRPEEVEARRCAISVQCRVWGGCHPRDGFCEPQSPEDCRQSLECLTQGRCTYVEEAHACLPTEPLDCARSTGCALEGICTWEAYPALFGGGGHCALTSFGDCTHTLACARDGRCAARPLGACSEGCRVFYCGRPESLSAPAPCTEMHGSGLLVCAPDGRCMANRAGECEHVP